MFMLEAKVAEKLAADRCHIAITGASGWIGLATIDLLMRALGDAFATRVSCYGSSARTLDLGDGRRVAQRPLSELSQLKADRVWVLHFAFQTKDRAQTMSEAAYRHANLAIADLVNDALQRIDVEALFVASSGAASRADDPAAAAAMRLYGAMKRDDETRFARWAELSGRQAVIGRIFAITGPYINKLDAYAIASFVRDAAAGRPVRVQASREVVRAYVAIRELMSLVFAMLGAGSGDVTRFDTGGEALELEAVARTVAETLGNGQVDRAPVTDPVSDRYVGDARGYAALLERHGIVPVPLNQQIREIGDYLAKVA